MVDDALVLRVERLGTSVHEFRRDLQRAYRRDAQVNATVMRQRALRLAEEWMVEIASHPQVKQALGDVVGDLSIQFNRLLTYSERRSLRRLYDSAIASILRDFHAKVIIPLKQARDDPPIRADVMRERPLGTVQSAFVGHSFADADRALNETVIRVLTAFHIRVETGERPSASSVSAKVKGRIDRCDAFVGIFSRRDRLSRGDVYTTSAWVIDEKAYAVARDRKLVLLKDSLVDSIGGLQGDYEYLEFTPDNLVDLVVRLVELLTEE